MATAIKKIDGVLRDSIKKIDGFLNGDPITKSLLHFNGSDGSTTFTDETGKTWSASGNAQLDTGDYAFATASLLLDGTGDSITTPNSSDFDFGTGDWTVDFWAKRNATQNAYAGLFSTIDGNYIGVEIDLSTDNKPRVISKASGSIQADIISSTTLGTSWTHVALVRNGNTLTLYLGGTSVGTRDCTGYNYNSAGIGMAIGRNFANDATNYLYTGWIDEFRVSKGLARWTGNFSTPSSQYTLSNQVKKFMGVSNI